MGTFAEKLLAASRMNNSLLCVGLDPELSFNADNVVELNEILVSATSDIACAYKPNLAIYESMGPAGLDALERTLDIIRTANPKIPIIGDAKRGDIGDCSEAYARTLFGHYGFDAATVSPYMGRDSLAPFLDHGDKGIFVLCRTSNPGGSDLQELQVVTGDGSDARPLYEVVAQLAQDWNTNSNVGLVLGATYPDQIRRVRQICPNLTFLIPGVGAQGGDIASTVTGAVDNTGGGFLINVSRQIKYAAKTPHYGRARKADVAKHRVRATARKLRDEINNQVAIALKERSPQLATA